MAKKLSSWLKKHKLLISFFIFLIILGIIYLPPKINAYLVGPEIDYKTVLPQKGSLTQTVDVSGEVKAENQATLKFQTSGKLAWVGVKKGDQVKKGQVLATLDKRELEKKLQKEIYDYLSERWDFEQTHDDYNTQGLPLEKSILSDAAKRILEKSQFDLNQTVLDLEIAALANELAVLTTPIAGIVTQVDSPLAGVNITPATANFVVTDPTKMYFETDIDEADISKIQIGQKVLVVLDAFPDEEFESQVLSLDFAAVATKGGGTAFPAKISLPQNENLKFKIGLNGDAQIIVAEKNDLLYIPAEAIIEKDGQTFVEIIDQKKLKEIPVETGLATDTQTEILSGLDPSQKVVTGEKKKEK